MVMQGREWCWQVYWQLIRVCTSGWEAMNAPHSAPLLRVGPLMLHTMLIPRPPLEGALWKSFFLTKICSEVHATSSSCTLPAFHTTIHPCIPCLTS